MDKIKGWGISAALIAVSSVFAGGLSVPANAQPVGQRPGDVCRVVDISSSSELFLYDAPDGGSNAVVAMFDGEQINLITRNVAGSDGLVYHEIEDSAGNRGYILASDPVEGTSTILNCSFAPFW